MHCSSSSTLNRTLLASGMAATAFMASGSVLPRDLAQAGAVIGLAILLIGAVRFHVLTRQRGAFLSRFLSPTVAELVDRRGSSGIMADSTCEISIVCADIRNFTRFSSNTGSAEVMQFLREYYDAVGAAVTACGGTVKDYAGDGILVLVGAPQPVVDHADRAVQLALAIREAALEVTSRWSRDDLPLGIGVGVASGPVTVGLVGGTERVEYAAVGPAVNLASRLCGKAGAGEILVDDRARELARRQNAAVSFQAARAMTVKGFDTPVESFAV